MTLEAKEIFNKFLAPKGNIWKECTSELVQYKQFMIELIHRVAVQLEHQTPLSISADTVVEATQVVPTVDGAGIMLDWLDRTIKMIHEGKELQFQYQKVTGLKLRVKKSEQLLLQWKNHPKHELEKLPKMHKEKPLVTSNAKVKISKYVNFVTQLDKVIVAFSCLICILFLYLFLFSFLNNEKIFETRVVITCTHKFLLVRAN